MYFWLTLYIYQSQWNCMSIYMDNIRAWKFATIIEQWRRRTLCHSLSLSLTLSLPLSLPLSYSLSPHRASTPCCVADVHGIRVNIWQLSCQDLIKQPSTNLCQPVLSRLVQCLHRFRFPNNLSNVLSAGMIRCTQCTKQRLTNKLNSRCVDY